MTPFDPAAALDISARAHPLFSLAYERSSPVRAPPFASLTRAGPEWSANYAITLLFHRDDGSAARAALVVVTQGRFGRPWVSTPLTL